MFVGLVIGFTIWDLGIENFRICAGFVARGGNTANPGPQFGVSSAKEFTDPRRLVKSASVSTSQSYSASFNPYGRRNSSTKSEREDSSRELSAVQSKTESMGLGGSRKFPAAQSVGRWSRIGILHSQGAWAISGLCAEEHRWYPTRISPQPDVTLQWWIVARGWLTWTMVLRV